MNRHRNPAAAHDATIYRPVDPVATVAVLDGIRVSWEWLCASPHPVTVDGTVIAGVPDRPIPLGELRALLLDPATSVAVRDAAWRYLIARSRGEGATWTVACAGMAMPMLAAALRECTPRGAGDREDIASAIVTGFVGALSTMALDRTGIASALRWSALRAGLGVVRDALALDTPAPRPHDDLIAEALTGAESGSGPGVLTSGPRSGSGPRSMPPPPRSAHPDLVLAAAVTDGVITVAEADLIGKTRLQRVSLVEIAARTGIPVGTVTMRRLRAEMRLVGHLLGSDGSDPDPAAPDDRTHTHGRDRSRTVTGSGAATRAGRPSGGGPNAAGAGIDRSPEVTGRRRRRTRGARRVTAGQVTR